MWLTNRGSVVGIVARLQPEQFESR